MLTFSTYVFAFLAYYAVGYGLQSGFRGFFFTRVPLDDRLVLDIAFMLVAGYVLVGAVCERITFRAFMLCELFLGGVLYPVFAEWVWRGGWLSRFRFVDFGGSSVVHELGGFCAMALAIVLGPRLGKYGHDGQPRPFLAHNIVFVTVGSAIVLFGWMALITGAIAPAAGADGLIARVVVNTNVAAVGGAAAAMLFWYVLVRKAGHLDGLQWAPRWVDCGERCRALRRTDCRALNWRSGRPARVGRRVVQRTHFED